MSFYVINPKNYYLIPFFQVSHKIFKKLYREPS